MGLIVAVQMDPIERIDIRGDSTFALMLEAESRGHDLYYYQTKDLSLWQSKVVARVRSVTVRAEPGNHATLGPPELIDLGQTDVILMRQDPPFDMGYITATHILEHLAPATLVVNDPVHVRNAPEKLLVTHFEDLMPPTLISADRELLKSFRTEHRDIILKPLYGNGGAGVVRLTPDDQNFASLLDLFSEHYRVPVIAQAYLPAVREGDKRIILVDGEPVGAINRVPAADEARSNLHVGGRADAVSLTERDREICAAIGPKLRESGLLFVGIDVIGTYLTEINVTSPTGIQEIKRFGGPDIASLIWDKIEEKCV